MREIEIKARIRDKQAVLAALQEQGAVLSAPVTQHDRVYGLPGVAGASENSEPWLRIRAETIDGATTNLFTLKKSVTNQLDSIEHEVTVGDDRELENIIRHLDFVPYSDLTKTRQRGHLGDFEVCLDHIEELGDFLEIEMLTSGDTDYQQAADELWRVFASLGINRADEVTDGYDVLMNKHLGKE